MRSIVARMPPWEKGCGPLLPAMPAARGSPRPQWPRTDHWREEAVAEFSPEIFSLETVPRTTVAWTPQVW